MLVKWMKRFLKVLTVCCYSTEHSFYSVCQIKVQFIYYLSSWNSPCTKAPYLKRAHEGLVHAHHGTSIVKLPTIVRRWEQSDELPLSEKFIAVLNDLQAGQQRKWRDGFMGWGTGWFTQMKNRMQILAFLFHSSLLSLFFVLSFLVLFWRFTDQSS